MTPKDIPREQPEIGSHSAGAMDEPIHIQPVSKQSDELDEILISLVTFIRTQSKEELDIAEAKIAINKLLEDKVREAQTNAVMWAIGTIDQMHMLETNHAGAIDRRYKGIKNTIRDKYKAEIGVDPAASYPVKATLKKKGSDEED